MADLTTAAAASASAGFTAATVAIIGVEPSTLFWSFVGAGLGLSWAAATGRFRAIAVFSSVTLGSALCGTWAAQVYFAGGPLASKGISFLLAVVAHPLLSAAITQLQPIAAGWADKLGAKRQ